MYIALHSLIADVICGVGVYFVVVRGYHVDIVCNLMCELTQWQVSVPPTRMRSLYEGI